MFELFFKYPVSTWRHAEFVWASGWPQSGLLLAAALGLLIILVSLYRQKLSGAKRSVIALLQFVAIATGLIMLWQPSLRLELMQAGENSVAYLIDTSNSMLNQDGGDISRRDAAVAILGQDELLTNDLFEASLYGMGDTLVPITLPDDEQTLSLPDLMPDLVQQQKANQSAIANSLITVLESVNDQALAAVVVLTDGADNASELSSAWWQTIKAAGVPVHTVGFGTPIALNDVELADVNVDSQVSADATVNARLRIVHNAHETVRVRVISGDELLFAQTVTLDANLPESVHNISFNSGQAGVRELRFSVEGNSDEVNLINNTQQRVLNVADQPRRVLYVEGEPRWEYKFIRRALHNVGSVSVVSLLRTSPNKFYRQGVESADELSDGIPKSKEALFAYDAIIIGSLEAAELSAEQQANLRDFVSERGGSLLMLAGRQGLGDGGWGRSALSAALPSKLTTSNSANDYERVRVQVQPTTQGYRTQWLQLEADEQENIQAWSELPQVNDMQPIGLVKPGSTTLLSAKMGSQAFPLLAWHRYGQGQSYILGTSGTWRWQMSLPSDNQWHEVFWQQFLSHLSAGSLPRLSIDDAQPVYRDAKSIPISVTARQSDFQPVNEAELVVKVTTPAGEEIQTTLSADINQPGRFIGAIEADQDGPYSVSVDAPLVGEAQAATQSAGVQRWLVKESGTAEQFDAVLHREFLQRVSAVTGGQYLDAADKDQLSQILTTQNAGLTREELLPLWNMPFIFLLLLLTKGSEWLLRLRWKRL